MKRTKKKLELVRKTIKPMAEADLRRVAGGNGLDPQVRPAGVRGSNCCMEVITL